jgi:KAP family P-loop domain
MSNFDYFDDAKFVTDQPADTDEFAGQAHARVAKSLVSIISQGEGGRAIGLEGTWGSGKSTVIDFALAQFKNLDADKTPKQRVFVFDAWAHQGDPLRRVFLEEFIASLASSGAIERNKWDAKLESLRSIRKKTTETRAENLSWVARITLLTLPLYPLAYGLLLEASKKDSQLVALLSKNWLIGIACLLIAAPYMAAFFTWISRHNDKSMKGRSVIWAFNKQTDHVTTEQLIREDEATTIEFNKVFDELVEDARERGNRIVIVLDNLDRLANDQIRDIWATMRNFFAATPGSKRRETLKNVWLVVPIDRQHIEAVFADGNVSSTEHTTTTRGFVEKTFEVVLRVPPLLLSSWRDFFTKKLSEAFGEKITAEDRYRIFRLFELYQTSHPTVITPRAVKAFINKLVGQARLSGDSIPIEYQSLYVLYRDNIAQDVQKLQDSTILDASVQASIVEPEWTKYLAAAHFNVSPDLALEILLGPEIEGALLEHRSDRLTELSKTSGFISILHGVIATKGRSWATENPSTLFDVAATLDRVDLGQIPALSHIWRDLTSAIKSIGKAVSSTDLSVFGIKAFAAHCSPKNISALAEQIKRALCEFKRELPETSAHSYGIGWFRMIESLSEATKGMSVQDRNTLFSKIPIQQNVQFLLGVAEAAAQSEALGLRNFSSSVPNQEVANAIVPMLQAPEVQESAISILNSLSLAPSWVDWSIVVNAAKTRLQTNTAALTPPTADRLLRILRRIGGEAKQEIANTALRQLSDDGSLHGIFDLENKASQFPSVAAILCDMTIFRKENWGGPNDHPQYGSLAPINTYLLRLQSEPSVAVPIVQAFASEALRRDLFDFILNLALPGDKNREFFRASIRMMIENLTSSQINPTNLIANFIDVEKILGAELSSRIIILLDEIDIASVYGAEKWKSLPMIFVASSQSLATRKSSDLTSAINRGLNAMSRDSWLDALRGETSELAFLIQLWQTDKLSIATTSFFDALSAHSKELVDGGKVPARFASEWSLLPKVLSEPQRSPFYKGLRDLLLESARSVDILVRLTTLFGSNFLARANLPERDEEVIRKILDPLLAAATDGAFGCIESNAESFRKVVDGASTSDREFILERIQALLLGPDESGKQRAQRIADLLGLVGDLEAAAKMKEELDRNVGNAGHETVKDEVVK